MSCARGPRFGGAAGGAGGRWEALTQSLLPRGYWAEADVRPGEGGSPAPAFHVYDAQAIDLFLAALLAPFVP